MLLYDKKIEGDIPGLEESGISPEKTVFFDIETTGLSWRRSHLYLLGAVYFQDSQWTLRQWFCQRPQEEREVLSQFADLISSRTVLVHFNGTTFDVPYLMHKYTFYHLEQPWKEIHHLDLYQKLQPYKKLLGLSHMRQKDLELLTGRNRLDPFSGGELITCYQEYLSGGNEKLLQTLLLHNREDVEGLLGLLPLMFIPRLFAGELPGPACAGYKDDLLVLKFSLKENPGFPFSSETPWYRLSVDGKYCQLQVPVCRGIKKYFFAEYKDYYYLPLEDEAIHKSVGAYVDREHREKARACNCYKKTEGQFLPQFSPVFTPEFRDSYKDKNSWFALSEDFLTDQTALNRYASHLLQNFRTLSQSSGANK